MKRDPSSLGMILAKLRDNSGLTQDAVVARMNNRGCYMTRQILCNIEIGRGTVKHTYIEAFLEVYNVDANVLFPPERIRRDRLLVGLTREVPTRKSRKPRCKHKPKPSTPK